MRLDEAIDQITDALIAAIQAERNQDGLLPEVEDVVRGDRARTQPRTPNLWVFPEDTAEQIHEPTTIREKWEMDFNIASVVKGEDPSKGYTEANNLAARARSAILKDRTLGLRDIVQDTKSGRFMFSGPGLSDGRHHSAAAVMRVTFTIKE